MEDQANQSNSSPNQSPTPNLETKPTETHHTWKDVFKAFFRRHKNSFLFIADVALNVVLVVGLVIVVRTFLFSPFEVSGISMCDTFNYSNGQCQTGRGDFIIVNKAIYQNVFGWQVSLPKRGQVVIFRPPKNHEEFLIKRVIGLPGETVELKDGDVYIKNAEHPQGIKLEEPYLNDRNQGNTHPTFQNYTVFQVPENSYFVMGDNRTNSSDSRACFKQKPSDGDCGENGNVPYITMKDIEGKAWILLWPLNKVKFVQDAVYSF